MQPDINGRLQIFALSSCEKKPPACTFRTADTVLHEDKLVVPTLLMALSMVASALPLFASRYGHAQRHYTRRTHQTALGGGGWTVRQTKG
jgi:hypothetical protein